MPGDSDDYPYGAVYRTVTCILVFGVRRRPDCQSTIQWMCKRLQNATSKAGRQMVKLLRYMKGTKDLATFLPVDGLLDKIYTKGDSEWACDDLDKRSLGGSAVAGGECRMPTHSRSLSPHALSSGEAKIMETTEVLKKVMLL